MSRSGQGHHHDLLNLPYFFTSFRSSEQVKEFLSHHRSRPGSYILRPSFSKPNCVSVSVVLASGEVRHLNIHLDSGRGEYYLVPECKFMSIPDLVGYYSVNPVHNEEQVTDVRFLHPVKRHERNQRRDTEPTLPTVGYVALHRSESCQNGTAPYIGENGTGRNRSGSDFGIHRGSSARSEGRILKDRAGSGPARSRSLTDNHSRRSPHDKLPTVPSNDLSRRPPVGLPNGNIPDSDKSGEYSMPRPSDVDLSGQLQETLRLTEVTGICDCGLPTKESQLPEGWSIHQTPENPAATRRLFYQSSEGRTFWVLPEKIASQLTDEHRENIKKLEEICKTPPPIAEEVPNFQ